MATSKKISQKDVVPSEIGSTGVYVNQSSMYYGDSLRELTFPYSLSTYDKMGLDVTIASALNAVNVTASRVPIYLEPFDQSDTHKKRASFVEQCFNDMDNGDTLDSVIQKALTFNKYGFAVLEKVFRRRRHKYGSKYDDGKIGLKYLPMRKQHSIDSFEWDDNYREVKGLYQNTTPVTNYSYMLDGGRNRIDLSKNVSKDGLKFIKRDSFMLFKADLSTDLPESISPLAACYKAWREMQSLKDLENIAASKNMNGILVGSIPSEYLSADADEDMKKAAEVFKASLSKITINQQGSILIPSARDDTGAKEWDITTLQSSSSHVTSITAIINNIKNQILQCLFADTLQTGDVVTASATNKKSMLNMLVETRIREILRIINTDLIPELFRRNGWDDSKIPQFKYGDLEEIDMAVFAKGMQQLRATRLVALTPKNINYIAEIMGLPDRVPEGITLEQLEELLGVEKGDVESSSGEGLASESGVGTAKTVPEADQSANNLSNV